MSTLGVDENSQGEKVQKEKKNNVLPLWGNERSMNLNPLILTNIQSSHYFKVNLYELKTYHEVIDEIYYKVTHLEPWEKGSRKTAGQTGMCGGVRGVGAGGIVSTAYCLLYKLFTLKLTRKQVNGLLTHPDSPYIRALGFMYIRYTQPPADLWDWYDEYLEDTEDMDVKAGGGHVMTIGDMLRHFLTKLEWFSTLFPRIPVPIQQKLERQLGARFPALPATVVQQAQPQQQQQPPVQPVQPPARGGRPPPRDDDYGEQERLSRLRRSDGEGRSPSQQGRSPRDSPSYRGEKRSSRPSSPSRSSKHARYDSPRPRFDREPSPRRDYEPEYRHSERYDRDYKRSERSNGYGGGGSSSRDRERGHRSHRTEESSSRHRHKEKDFASELARERERQQQRREKSRERERTGSR